jgi:uncharacterized protein YqgQ
MPKINNYKKLLSRLATELLSKKDYFALPAITAREERAEKLPKSIR